MKPRKGDYGDVPALYKTIQVSTEKIEIQYQHTSQQEHIQVVENVQSVPTQIFQTDSIELPSNEVHTLQDTSYYNRSGGLQNTEEHILLQQQNISFAFNF